MTTHAPPRADVNSRISVHAPPWLVNSITEYSELYFEKLAPYLDSSEDDLLFFVRLALIRRSTHCHVLSSSNVSSPRASTRLHTLGMWLAHAFCHLSLHGFATSILNLQSACHVNSRHVIMPRGTPKKKKNLVRRDGLFYSPNSSSRPL